MTTVYVEKNKTRIEVRFEYSRLYVARIKEIPGRAFNDNNKMDKHWRVPLDMATCRHLRDAFGADLHIGPELRAWAREQNRIENQLGSISTATSAVLTKLPTLLPKLHRALYVGPLGAGKAEDELEAMMAAATEGSFQTADVAFLAAADNPLNANQPGLGKTLETIAAIYERYGMDVGKVLVVAPKVALEAVWGKELGVWQPAPVFVLDGPKRHCEAVVEAFGKADAGWLVVNQEKIRLRKDPTNKGKVALAAKERDWKVACKCDRLKDPHWHYEAPFPELADTEWTVIVVDECHKGAIRNSKTITAITLNELKILEGGKKMALSGTPMKNSAVDLWGVLHWLNPVQFSSLWNWAGRWCEIMENAGGYKVIGPLREDRKEELFRSLTPYVLRRTKKECVPWLPDKRIIDIECHMSGKQLKQYKEMDLDATVTLGDDRLPATNVLSEFLRLTQFAIAAWTIKDGKLVPTEDSCKLDQVDELLAERGIFEAECEEKVVIFSQFREVVEMVVRHLRKKKVEVVTITGAVNKPGERAAIQRKFQGQGGARVIVMTTTAGGVAITLDAADTVIFLDEMWSPADMEQAEDRVHRVSRLHQVTIYYLRTVGSIDDYRMETVGNKAELHREVLDLRRQYLADRKAEK